MSLGLKILLIADVHANLHALKAVLKASGPVDRIVCLGDVATYGPCPLECLSLIKRKSGFLILGNHDLEVLKPSHNTNNGGSLWLDWTRQQVGERGLAILESLPTQAIEYWEGHSVLLVHNLKGSVYISSTTKDDELYDLLPRHDMQIVAFGHSHQSMLRRIKEQIVMNPGSVGQPRDGDPRASYAIWKDEVFRLFRVEYDVEKTIGELRKLPLPPNFIDQWCQNYREGTVF